jgi:hypothetical protein
MTSEPAPAWQVEFGIESRMAPSFFRSLSEVEAAGHAVSQAHVLRRAFEGLCLDGVLCQDNTPIIYIRVVERIDAEEVAALHRTFWNQGVAPIRLCVAPDEVHVYSGLSRPTSTSAPGDDPEGFVEKLERVSETLRAFVLSFTNPLIRSGFETANWPVSLRKASSKSESISGFVYQSRPANTSTVTASPSTRCSGSIANCSVT